MNQFTSALQDDALSSEAVELVKRWIERSKHLETPEDAKTMDTLEGVVVDPDGLDFVMAFVDRVIRPDDNAIAAEQLKVVTETYKLPNFLSPIDKMLLKTGSKLATTIPAIVVPLAKKRVRAIVGHLLAPAEPKKLARHLSTQISEGYDMNVNLLGEAVLGEKEAAKRLADLLELLKQPDVDYVSVKISSVASQLNYWAHEDSLNRVSRRLETLMDAASSVTPQTFVNLDMEEYHDLELTLEAFMNVMGTPERAGIDAGIVLQAYLPDALGALQRLSEWTAQRHAQGGGTVKVRLVKGANLAMEKVDATMHGWEQAPYESKVEADANYKKCLDWVLHEERLVGLRIGVASHNLFDIAWSHLLANQRGVANKIQFEMLQGMAPAQASTVAEATSEKSRMLMYTPAVRDTDFDVAISYLFRRLEENASDDNFMRHLFNLEVGSEEFASQQAAFVESLKIAPTVFTGARRTQNRLETPVRAYEPGQPFMNDPETDTTLAANQQWITQVLALKASSPSTPVTAELDGINQVLATAKAATTTWAATSKTSRQVILQKVGDELAARRGELVATMMAEGNKTFVEADGEVCEAIDFARYYADAAPLLDANPAVKFSPLGVVAVIPPWNFPVAIPAGGVLSSLAAGNTVIFKPAPETPRCAELVAEAAWAAGVPADVLQFVRTPDNEVGRALVEGVDAVILTGSTETADLFRSWKPDLKLFAETSGKNALIITPNADMDLAVADLVGSAFSHSGQKCSAASLAILVGPTYESERFRRQLVDAVESMELGLSQTITTTMGPLVGEANERLARGFQTLDAGEEWLVEPKLIDAEANLWSPGVRLGVKRGSWFHTTECFGPILGLMKAETLEEAIEIQNSSAFGLTGGIHTLYPQEIETWMDKVEIGNAYINRGITGAIVQRQPFGGWKRSSVGPGAKAGGPDYLAQLGTWSDSVVAEANADDYQEQWNKFFSIEQDPTGLFCEANIYRYRPLPAVGLWVGAAALDTDVARVRKAAKICGVRLLDNTEPVNASFEHFLQSVDGKVERVRVVGHEPTAAEWKLATSQGIYLSSGKPTGSGRVELVNYLRPQAISRTLHRFGNLVSTASAN